MIIEAWGGLHDGKLIQLAEGVVSLGVVHIPMGPPPLNSNDPMSLVGSIMNDPLTAALEYGIYECWLEPHPLGVDRMVVKNPEHWW